MSDSWISVAALDLWQLDFCSTEDNPTICLLSRDADTHSAWQEFANQGFTPVPLKAENTAEVFNGTTFFLCIPPGYARLVLCWCEASCAFQLSCKNYPV